MNKETFLSEVGKRLAGLPEQELGQSLAYYREMIEDRIEDGMQEEEAVAAMGSVEEAASQILNDTSLPKLVKTKVKLSRTMKAWEIALLIAGSPVWVPIFVCIVILFFTFYLVIGILLVVLHIVNLAFAAAAVGGVGSGIIQFFIGAPIGGTFYIGAGLFFAGAAVLLFFGAKHIDRAVIRLTKRFGIWVKSRFLRRIEKPRQGAGQEEASV